MDKIAISGAGGFLGKNIVYKVVNENFAEIILITSKENLKCTSKVKILNTEDFLSYGYDFTADFVFINCLFPTNADGYKMASGLEKVYKCMAMAEKGGVGAFINISSQSVYDSKRKFPAKETDYLCLENAYAVGKYSSEIYGDAIFNNIPYTNIRLSSLIGVEYDYRIVNRMIMQALKGEQLKIVGGMQRYGLLDVRDAVDGIIKVAKSEAFKWKNVYNLGRMDSVTLLEIVNLIVKILSDYGIATNYVLEEGMDMRNSSIDASLFMEEFDWFPRISLKKSVEDIIRNKWNSWCTRK